MRDIFDEVDDPGFTQDELCGVFFYDGYAYSTNNHIIGRMKFTGGSPVKELMFWSFTENSIITMHDKFLLNFRNYFREPNDIAVNIFKKDFIAGVEYTFNMYTENYFFVKRSDILAAIESKFKSDKSRVKTSFHCSLDSMNLKINFLNFRGKSLWDTSVPICTFFSTSARLTDDLSFSVNALYLYKILNHSIFECDIIGIKFKNNPLSPVVIFGRNTRRLRPEIHWAIAQTTKKNTIRYKECET